MMFLNGFIFFILVLVAANRIDCNHATDFPPEDEIVYQAYNEADKNLRKLVNSAVKYMLTYVMEAREHLNISSQCTNDMFQLMMDLRNLKLSALSFIDAAGKLPEGMLLGRSFLLGDYEECLNATVKRKNGDVAFKGQYCVVSMKPPLPRMKKSQTFFTPDKQLMEATKNVSEFMKYFLRNLQIFYYGDSMLGICVPTGCNSDDINAIVNYLAKQVGMNTKVDYCDYEDKYPVFRPRMIVSICILSLLGLLAFIGTILDYCYKERNITQKSLGIQMLICFSFMTNIPKLLTTKASENPIRCLAGIRSLSLFYIILLHEYLITNELHMHAHLTSVMDVLPSFFFHIITNGILTVEVFFFIGGLVNCYIRMKMNELSKHKENPLKLFIHRLCRIYPALLLVTFVIPNIFEQGYGPRRVIVKQFFRNCDTNWWKNLVFVNNFFDQEETVCMPQTWYISADAHLFIISLFTIPVLFKNPKKGLLLHLGLILCGITVTSIWVWHKNIPPTGIVLRPIREDTRRYWNAYSTTPPHIATYFAGVLVGYFLYINTKKPFKMSKAFQIAGWPVAGLLLTSMLFLPMRWNTGTEYTVLESALYFSLSRFIFVLAVAWMVICCATGYGGLINYILSLKIWFPIARISYMTYLVSPAIQLFYGANLRLIYDFHNMILIWRYFGDILASCLLSLVLVVVVESPFIAMEKFLLRRTFKQNTDEHVKGNDNPDFITNFENNIVSENNFKNTVDIARL